MTTEQAKAEAEARKVAEAAESVTPPETPPEAPPETPPEPPPAKPVVTPKPKRGEGEKPSVEGLQQQLSTTQGMLTKTQGELSELKKKGTDFEGLRSDITQVLTTLELHTDVISSMAEGNEELQEKIRKSREASTQRAEQEKQYKSTFTQMGNIAKIGEMQPQDEGLKPAFEALNKGDHAGAIQLTTLAVQAKVSAAGIKPSETPEATKKKLPVVTSQSATPQNWRDEPAKSKILGGLQDKREE